jgi:DeoR/GlpR family transcriptional regulator of sugar metabolism
MLAEERRRGVFAAIEAQGAVQVHDLARRFAVAPITITRDLRDLEEQGLIRRIHGGAISVRGANFEPPFIAREGYLAAEKKRIAACALEMVQDGDSVILDVGTTTLEIARALRSKRNLTVLVSNLRAAFELSTQPAIQVVVIGGKLRTGELSMVGHLAEEMLRGFQADRAFIGVGGITVEQGLTEFNIDEAGTKRVMLASARARIVVADHTKIGKVMLNVVAPLTAAQTIITSEGADPEVVARARHVGVDVRVV